MMGAMASTVKGTHGNVEFLLHAVAGAPVGPDAALTEHGSTPRSPRPRPDRHRETAVADGPWSSCCTASGPTP